MHNITLAISQERKAPQKADTQGNSRSRNIVVNADESKNYVLRELRQEHEKESYKKFKGGVVVVTFVRYIVFVFL